jgi:DNA replication and repair protein RecF
VLFAPEDLQLVKGDPDARRRFLDDLLIARSPRYHAVRADYDRVLKQRNTLLKTSGAATRAARSGGGDLRTLDVWDEHLARHGSELLAGRLEIVDTLRPLVDKSYDAVSGGSGPTRLDYKCSLGADVPLVPDRDMLAAAIAAEVSRVRPQELERGVSLVGPHRDDLVLAIGDFPAKGYATRAMVSRGRWRWRCGSRRTTCWPPTAASRCWCSTTSSPSSTPAGATGSPSSS